MLGLVLILFSQKNTNNNLTKASCQYFKVVIQTYILPSKMQGSEGSKNRMIAKNAILIRNKSMRDSISSRLMCTI